jgi:hypothetical protein
MPNKSKRRSEPTPLRLQKRGQPTGGLTSYRAAAHKMIDREFNLALDEGLRVDGFMLVVVSRDDQLHRQFRSDGRWEDVGDILLALKAAEHKALAFWFREADWTPEA